MADEVRIIWHDAAIASFRRSEENRAHVIEGGRDIARAAAAAAPRRTGAGAGSIHPEAVLDDGDWTARVSWEQQFDYMRFHELGTEHLPARHFLENAADRYARL